MTNDLNQSGRRIKFTLTVRNEADDPSILDMLLVAIKDCLRAPATPHEPEQREPQPRAAYRDDLCTEARDVIEKALADIPTPTDPKFDPAKWVEQLTRVWHDLRNSAATGMKLDVVSDQPPTQSDTA